MGTGNGEPGGGVYQGSESAYGDCTRRSTAADETGDAGALVDIVLAMAMVECGLNGKEQQELVPYVVRGFILL